MKQKQFAGIVILSFVLAACTKEESIVRTEINQPLLFVLAGQSNAEGAVFWEGLERLQRAIPATMESLGSEEQRVARHAISQSLGVFCEVSENCAENPIACENTPFSFETADTVIEGLLNSSISWRDIDREYQNPQVKLRAINYRNSNPTIVDANGQIVDNENCLASEEVTTLVGPNLESYTTDEIVPLGMGFGAETNNGRLSFGPELSFGLKIAQTVATPTILKVTMGGSTLNDSWRMSGTLYQSLIAETHTLLEEEGLKLGGFIWFQGFNDQFEDAYCNPLPEKYETNLRQFLGNLRGDLNTPNLPVVIVGARSEGELTTIQAAQNKVVSEDVKAEFVVTDDLSDCFHYGSGSQILIGERIGEKIMELIR